MIYEGDYCMDSFGWGSECVVWRASSGCGGESRLKKRIKVT